MSYETTLFAHIAPRLTDRIEDVAVEALGHILSNSEAARSALEEAVRLGGANVGSIDRVVTQVTDEEGARPDLAAFDDKGDKRVLIEAKFWAALTPNQPNQYLDQLRKGREDRPAALLFVAPKSRLEFLWPELCNRAKEKEPKFEISLGPDLGDLRNASIADGKLRLLLTSWSALLGRMETHACEAGDTVALADIKQLLGLTNNADPHPFVSWSPDELGGAFPRRMKGLQRLIDDATECGKNASFLTRGSIRKGGAGGYGRTIHLGCERAWFGIEVLSWAKSYRTPLWLRLDGEGHGRLKKTQLAEGMFRPSPGWSFRVPIKLPAGVEYDEVLNSVVSHLQTVARQLDPDSVAHAISDSEVKQLRSRADRMDPLAFLPWRPEELEPLYARRLVSMHGIIDEAIDFGRNAGFLQRKTASPKLEGGGWTFRIGGVKAWLGIHIDAWALHCNTPLWLVFDHHEGPRLANVTASVHEVNWKHCIPIDVPATAEHDEVLETVIDSLKDIAIQLEDSNG